MGEEVLNVKVCIPLKLHFNLTGKAYMRKEDKNNVWHANVRVVDFNSKNAYTKESTFFPRSWSITILFHECGCNVKFRQVQLWRQSGGVLFGKQSRRATPRRRH